MNPVADAIRNKRFDEADSPSDLNHYGIKRRRDRKSVV